MIKKEKYLLDYKEELQEYFPYIPERQLVKMIRRMSTLIPSFLGKKNKMNITVGKGFAVYYDRDAFRFLRTVTVGGRAKLHFKYLGFISEKLRRGYEKKCNKIDLELTKKPEEVTKEEIKIYNSIK